MKELSVYKHHIIAIITAVKKPTVVIPAIGLMSFSGCQLGMFLLLILMALDFATGVLASWNIWHNSKVKSNFWKYGFSSKRVRLSLVKSITYFLFIICSFGIEYIFKVKSFGVTSYSDHEITLTFIAITLSCAIEFYSIFFENLPKAGFDIWEKLKLIAAKVKSGVSTVKDITDGGNDNSTT